MFQGCFKSVSRKIEGGFNGALSGVQVCLKEANGCLREVSKVSQGRLGGVPRDISG